MKKSEIFFLKNFRGARLRKGPEKTIQNTNRAKIKFGNFRLICGKGLFFLVRRFKKVGKFVSKNFRCARYFENSEC